MLKKILWSLLSLGVLGSMPGYEMPAFAPAAPPSPPPLTAQEISAINEKLATMREAFGMILDFSQRNQQPETINLPDVQRLYRMMEPIVKAAEQTEILNNRQTAQINVAPPAPQQQYYVAPSRPAGGCPFAQQLQQQLQQPQQQQQQAQPLY